VVAAAVILPARIRLPGIADSKLLSPQARERLYPLIIDGAVAVGWSAVGPRVVDRINILQASHLAMKLALERLDDLPDAALVDGNPVPGLPCPHENIVRGDARELVIACASVVAKVVRDRMMVLYDAVYDGYGLAEHKGYATRAHLDAIDSLGPSPIHRLTFSPMTKQLSLF